MLKHAVIYWFRNDLRLADNPALTAALQSGSPVVPVFVYCPEDAAEWAPGSASQWWLHHSLLALNQQLSNYGAFLVIRKGPAEKVLASLAKEIQASEVFFNCRYEPWARKQETDVQSTLASANVKVHVDHSALLFAPEKIINQSGLAYKVFTPFWRQLQNAGEPSYPLSTPQSLPTVSKTQINKIASLSLSDLNLLSAIGWDAQFPDFWQPGEQAAEGKLERFLPEGLSYYGLGRDRPDKQLVSMLSPHLHFGEISVRRVWHAVKNHCLIDSSCQNGADAYLRELGFREFAYHLLYHFPQTTNEPMYCHYKDFPWQFDESLLALWQQGKTGYPIVDAGMRQLWSIGWMHNRVRMVVASFLVKDLLIPWQHGAKWFWDTLVDADLANNSFGWQWAAGSGADAAPYFRIFNPVLQGKKFDPSGAYVRKWVPELKKLDAKWIHSPWLAPDAVLGDAGIKLGRDYPYPIVDHKIARERALAALKRLEQSRQ